MLNPQDFKIHCSQIGKIMGRVGLTDIQLARMIELDERSNGKGKPLTENMVKELITLERIHENPTLPATCTTYLHEWYANDFDEISTKYTNKGEMVENDLIDFAISQLGYGVGEKNLQSRSDEYLVGTCDVVLPDAIMDVKAPWSRETLHKQLIAGLDKDYEWQLRGYMHLYDRTKSILFYGLMDTPPEVNYTNEVIYSDMPDNERWFAYNVTHDSSRIQEVIERVKACRIYLEGYDAVIKSKLGRVLV